MGGHDAIGDYGILMFDSATIREELAAMERKLKERPQDHKLVDRYIGYARKLRDMEYDENGFVSARNNVTGY